MRRTCFSVEPGIYLSGFGGVRIEDTVVVTDDDAQALERAGITPHLFDTEGEATGAVHLKDDEGL